MDTTGYSKRARKLKGFTLLEMIVVMAIIGVLASIIVPNTVSQMRQARIEEANSKAKQVYQAVQDYCTRMQIKKVPLTAPAGEPAAFPYTTPTGTDKKILVQFVGAKADDLKNALICYMGGQTNSGYAYVEVEKSAAKFGQWAGSKDDTTAIFGEYPNELNANKVKNGASWGAQTNAAGGAGAGT